MLRISVRPATEDDAESIVAILNPIIQAGTLSIMDRTISVDEQRAFIRSLPASSALNVAVDADAQAVVGMQDIQRIFPHIEQFRHVCEIATFVALPLRRRGIGDELTRASFAAAIGLGYRKIVATIRADNPDAQAFYANQGFRVIGTATKQALVRGAFIDEILVERWLE